MSGMSIAPDDEGESVGKLPLWEALAVDAVGNTIDFWRFKRNHGRIWALLYLRDRAMTAPALQEELGLSKGAVSMLVRELEQWGVVRRVRAPGEEHWRYAAEVDFRKMISRVIEERESLFVRRVRLDLEEAERLAKLDRSIDKDVIKRIARLSKAAQLVDQALVAFLQTARLDVVKLMSIFVERT